MIDILIASVTDEKVKEALRTHRGILLSENLTTADDLKDTTLDELEKIGIKALGDRKRIKKAFPDAGVCLLPASSAAGPDLHHCHVCCTQFCIHDMLT